MLNKQELENLYGEIHPGLDLVTVIPVGIPVHTYNVDLYLYESKDYPLLNEHVLKSVELGLKTVSEISKFLGISETFVAEAVAHEDTTAGTLAIAPSGNLRLTGFGMGKLADLTFKEAIKKTQQLHADLVTGGVTYFRKLESTVDRLTASLEGLEDGEYVRRLDVQNKAEKEYSDFSLEVVDELLTSSEKMRRFSVLQVLASKRSSQKPFFALGQVMVFADEAGERIMVNMLIDGERAQDYDVYLALDEVRQSLNVNIEKSPELPAPGSIFRTRYKGSTSRAQNIVQKLEALPEVSEEKIPTEVDEANSAPSPLKLLRQAYLGPALFKPQTKPARLKVTDLSQIRREALRFAKSRILFISPWVKAGVVNSEFLRMLEEALFRGVKIDVAIGIGEDLSDSDSEPIAKLVTLAKKHPNLMTISKWKSHEKVLIADDSYVESTFNWLSFQGVNDRHYRRERGTLTVDKELADEVYEELLVAIDQERDLNWP